MTSQHILRNRYNDSFHRYTIHQIDECFTKRWQRSDHALISQHILRNRYNDSLNRWTIHQIVERFTKHWQRFDHALISQYIPRNHCNYLLNHCNDFLTRWTMYRALVTFWPLLTNSLISLLFSRNVITTCWSVIMVDKVMIYFVDCWWVITIWHLLNWFV
jgi:hypothetical protein